METALIQELSVIFNDDIYPTHAPEGKKSPYLVYHQDDYSQLKTLTEIKNNIDEIYILNIMAPSYEQMKELRTRVKNLVISFLQRNIGENGVYISDLTINKVTGTYERELKLHRGIIDVTFSYKE